MSELEARFDGPIPRDLCRNACQQPLPVAVAARITVRVSALKPAFIVETMARTLVEAFQRGGSATEADLHLAGFDADSISRHGTAAKFAALATLSARGLSPEYMAA